MHNTTQPQRQVAWRCRYCGITGVTPTDLVPLVNPICPLCGGPELISLHTGIEEIIVYDYEED